VKSEIYIAPNRLGDHQYLLNLAKGIGVRENSIRQLFWLINAPAKLTALTQVMSNLKCIIQIILENRVYGPHLIEAPFFEWIKFCDYIEENTPSLSLLLGEHIYPYGKAVKDRETHPMRRKGMTRHAMYTSLWNLHQNIEYQDTFARLQAHTFFAHLKLMLDTTTLHDYESYEEREPLITTVSITNTTHDALDKVCRFLRDLSLSNKEPELEELKNTESDKYGEFTPIFCSTRRLANFLIRKHQNLANKYQSEMTNKFGIYFWHVYGSSPQPNKREGGGGGRRHKINYTLHDGFVTISPTVYKFLYSGVDNEDLDLDLESQTTFIESIAIAPGWYDGSNPNENESGVELHLVSQNGNNTSYLAALLAAEAQANQTSVNNQMLPNRWNIMTSYEIEILLTRLKHILTEINAKQYLSPRDLKLLEGITLLFVMLATGSDLDRALKLTITNSSFLTHLDFIFQPDSKSYTLKNNTLLYRTSPTRTQDQKSRNHLRRIVLPDLLDTYSFIDALIKHKNIQDDSLLFRKGKQSHLQNLKAILKSLPVGNRITIHKISTLLFNSVLYVTAGDVTMASLITCTSHHLSRTPLHYTTLCIDEIIDIHRLSLINIQKTARYQPDNIQEALNSTHTNVITNKFFGSRLCPQKKAIKSLISNLSKQIRLGPKQRDLEGIIDYHNIYTVYTSQMLSFATGIRAIRDPYISDRNIIKETGIALITDKDGEDFYNSRLVWLNRSVLKQLEYYAEHRSLLLNCLSVYSDVISDTSTYPEMFLLNKSGQLQNLRPKTISSLIQHIYPFPINVNRRYLRTQLVERGCPVEIINGFMGHWANGEEYWGKFSTLSFDEIISHLKKHLPEIQTSLGWKDIPSRVHL